MFSYLYALGKVSMVVAGVEQIKIWRNNKSRGSTPSFRYFSCLLNFFTRMFTNSSFSKIKYRITPQASIYIKKYKKIGGGKIKY